MFIFCKFCSFSATCERHASRTQQEGNKKATILHNQVVVGAKDELHRLTIARTAALLRNQLAIVITVLKHTRQSIDASLVPGLQLSRLLVAPGQSTQFGAVLTTSLDIVSTNSSDHCQVSSEA